jgi:predicted GIY-YIG superfamily endonuclease
MYYVYILKHPTEERIYIGFSTDLRSRLKRHRSEHPVWRLAYYEAYASEANARARERRLKHYGNVQQLLKKRIIKSLNAV